MSRVPATAAEHTAHTLESTLTEPPMALVRAHPSLGRGESPVRGAGGVAVVAVPIAAGDGSAERATPQPRHGAGEAAADFGVDVVALAEVHGITGKAGDVLAVPPPPHSQGLPSRLVLIGLGSGSPAELRKAGAALARATMGTETVRTTAVDSLPEELQRAFIEGFLLGGYRPPRAGSSAVPKPMAAVLEVSGLAEGTAAAAAAGARATWLVRDLANMPSNVKNPEWMAGQAGRLAGASGLSIHVWDEHQLADEGFGGLLAVGSASPTPPRLVQLDYTPARAGKDTKHIVIVGKGITFDTGGLSLKPREPMVPMKTDMAGAGVVMAVLAAAAELGVQHRVTGLLALAENSIGAGSYRPGDVVTVYNGTTVEIGNTDAEGRMVLADGLAYATARLQPDVLVDVATLTGAAAMGLGKRHAALYGSQPELLRAFEAAGEATGERVWHMPLEEVAAEYSFALESGIADISHIASQKSKVGGGSITAALFLREFVGGTPWIHLDIAGPARADSDQAEVTKGATGYGARLLLSFLSSYPG
ncbi:leucyl aminopeptidase family protein [Arthrobacter sulfonylureivorans]|uniref:Probable cytosol aminopeptidase n=1 Tax=Arthrobacter sulfonylureivorans TaxID=2486855 RepID=A0ABY3W9H8_9MICC|nr:leucyl aminopeptidase family protein [Arthrobacter sulfonylureivorans]UNK46995.1 leucyl aminopeptidase family protein [Arthrobacter sulfonylureivorans]